MYSKTSYLSKPILLTIIIYSFLFVGYFVNADPPLPQGIKNKIENFGSNNIVQIQSRTPQVNYANIDTDRLINESGKIYGSRCLNKHDADCVEAIKSIQELMKNYCSTYPQYCEKTKGRIMGDIESMENNNSNGNQIQIWNSRAKYIYECTQNPYSSDCVLSKDEYNSKVNLYCGVEIPRNTVSNPLVIDRINKVCKQTLTELAKDLEDPKTSTQDFLGVNKGAKQTGYKLRKDLKFYYYAGEKHPEDSDLYKLDMEILAEVLKTVPPKYISQLNYIFLTNQMSGLSSIHTVGIYNPLENTMGILRKKDDIQKKIPSTVIHEFGHFFTGNNTVYCQGIGSNCTERSEEYIYGFRKNTFTARYFDAFKKYNKDVSFVSKYAKLNILEDMAETFTVAIERKDPFEKPVAQREKGFLTKLSELVFRPEIQTPSREVGIRRLKIGFFLTDPKMRQIIKDFKERQDPARRKIQDEEFAKS